MFPSNSGSREGGYGGERMISVWGKFCFDFFFVACIV